MAEIFFIASDERALDLIESLRIQSPKSLTFETDLPSAIRRLPKEHPRYVFIQSSLDGIPCEEIATQTRELVTDPSVQLILLDENGTPGRLPAGFDRSFSLALPTSRLSAEVLQLLTMEVVAEISPKSPTDFSDLSDLADIPDLFTMEERPEFEIPDFDDGAFEPHLAPLWPVQPETRPVSDAAKGSTAAPRAAKEADAAPTEEIGFFVSEPAPPPPPARPSRQEAPTAPVIPAAEEPQAGQEATAEPPAKASKHPKSLYPTPDQIYRKPPELCGEALEEDDTEPAPEAADGRNSGTLVKGLAIFGVVALALGVVVWQRSKPEPARPSPGTTTAATAPAPAAPPPTAATPRPAATPQPAPATAQPAPTARQGRDSLPHFVPAVPADAAYAAAHPGWELYRGDGKQFRIYREQGKLRAIQVLAEGGRELDESLMGSYFKEATGANLPGKGEAREGKGLVIETRKAGNGAEIAIYRDASERRIRGLVLQLPDSGHK
ncbi:hypothetical protein [Geomonas azotofigens]|uniref:hypothetical protein n=1 Tax=Geomonas azotofigens TaxID=2843196 RepID=UPI001C101EC8|nr:hypothetical protein [Geomonas azotofigens]MBU5614387.1 hypothetical protein [Geomonas azotofigens]